MLQNNTFLDSNFERIFYVLASENEGKIEQFAYFYRLSKTQILQKSLFSLGKITLFLVRSLEKSTNIGCSICSSNAIKSNVKKESSKTEFGSHLAFQNP